MKNFTIEERFGFLDNYLKLIKLAQMNSLIISGTSGIGKSYQVIQFLKDNNIPHTYVKGYSTARGMYDKLYENRNGLIIFDDCDSVLDDKVGVNILKGALDSYDDRVISWLAKNSDKSIPNQFNFQGQVIFISNLPLVGFDKAILSRALSIDLEMTFNEKLERMLSILPNINPEVSFDDKYTVLANLIEYAKDEETVNIRTLEKGIVFFKNDPTTFERQFEFYLS